MIYPVWVLIWVASLDFSVKALLHKLHWYGFSPVCVFIWVVWSVLCMKVLSHWLHWSNKAILEMKFRWLALCVLELEGRSGPLRNFSPFFQSYVFGAYYKAWEILIADVKCIMRTSFLQSFVSLVDQGDPTEPLIQKCCQAGCCMTIFSPL